MLNYFSSDSWEKRLFLKKEFIFPEIWKSWTGHLQRSFQMKEYPEMNRESQWFLYKWKICDEVKNWPLDFWGNFRATKNTKHTKLMHFEIVTQTEKKPNRQKQKHFQVEWFPTTSHVQDFGNRFIWPGRFYWI